MNKVLAVIIKSLILVTIGTLGHAEPIALDSNKQLFIDDYLIESVDGFNRTLHEGKKSAPVLEPEKPWEGGSTSTPTLWVKSVIIDSGKFKMHYWTTGDGTNGGRNCYAVSDDGVNWTRPNLGIQSYAGIEETNITNGVGNVTITKNPDPELRYQSLAGHHFLKSADGINFSLLAKHTELGDVTSMAYDSTDNAFLICKKGVRKDGDVYNPRKQYQYYCKDLTNCTQLTKLTTIADEIDGQGYVKAASYGMGMGAYEGAYIGFNWLFQITKQYDGMEDGPIEVQFLYKRPLADDARRFLGQWQRPSHDPIIPRGKNGEWDDGMVMTSNTPLRVDNEIWMYYSGWDGIHMQVPRTCKIGLAKWRLDGFMSMDAEDTEGTLLTKQLAFNGKYLLVNADASAEGAYMLFELLDSTGSVITGYSKDDCDTVSADSVEHVISWQRNNELSDMAGQPVQLKIYAANAELYAIKFGQPEFEQIVSVNQNEKVSGPILQQFKVNGRHITVPGQVERVNVYDLQGKLILTNRLQENTSNWYLAGNQRAQLNQAVYLLELSGQRFSKTIKLINQYN
ncbi:MAG: hypothetical protein HQK83_08335 [Fibrobacteria bacterium]|nr:hypothetical protein [Fibrobacteria bacterium]